MAITDEQKARLEALRAKRVTDWKEADEVREQLAELEDLEHENLLRDVVAKLESDGGKRGVTFDLIESSAGIVAVKVGDAIHYQQLLDAIDSTNGLQIADMQTFLLPNICYPARDAYVTMCQKHPALPVKVWPVLAALYRGERDLARGK